MKNSEIHFGLKKSELRDFLSISMVKNYEQEFENKKQIIDFRPTNQNAFEWSIKDCENEISFHSKRLQLLKEKQSITTLIKMQGWEEFDVSNETEHDLQYNLKMNFIGTKSEYDAFIIALESER